MPFRIKNRVWHIIRDYDHEYTEFMLALFKILIGFWYIMPWDSFSSSSSNKYFGTLAPELIWGIVFLSIGLWQMYLVLHGTHYKYRSIVSLIGIWMWTIFTVLTVLGNWRGAGWTITLVFALSNIVIYLRLKNISDYVDRRNTALAGKTV